MRVGDPPVRLGLAGSIVSSAGARSAIGITAKSIDMGRTPGQIKWSALGRGDPTLLALSMASHSGGASERILVSVRDSVALPHANNRDANSLPKLVADATTELDGFAAGTASIDASGCDRCRVRLVCPWWLDLASPWPAVS